MEGNLSNKYFVSRDGETWEDVTTKFNGVKVLAISGIDVKGDALNVYTAQWVDSQEEDYYLVGEKVIRSNVDLEMTFVCGTRYASNMVVDTQDAYDTFVDYICNDGDFYVKSAYDDKTAHVVCLKGVKITTQKLHRGINSYILATATLHTLDAPKKDVLPVDAKLYIGFNGSYISSEADILSLLNIQSYAKENPSGDYSIQCPSVHYLWICSTVGGITSVSSSGFEVPMNEGVVIGDYICYRSGNSIAEGLMNFTIEATT